MRTDDMSWTTDDMALLKEYARSCSDEAFEVLVSRHINMVYSVALRRVGDASLAEEITQVVFVILAQKAGSLGSNTILSGWLCRTARFASANALTIQRRRQHREQEAYMQSCQSETEAWRHIAPLLDEAMAKLGHKDHDAIVLRFFEDKTMRDVGVGLGINETAARKRVNRAVEKLRDLLTQRGTTLSVPVIVAAISAHSVQAAPASLVATITAASAKGAAATISSLTLLKGTLKLMAWTELKTAAAVAAIAVVAVSTTLMVLQGTLQGPGKRTFSSFDFPTGPAGQTQWGAGRLQLVDNDLNTVLTLYGQASGRTVIRADGLPEATFTLHNQTPLNRVETLRLLDTLLAQNGVTMVLAGDSHVKAVPSAKAVNETAPVIQLSPDELPESSSYMSMTVPWQKTGLPVEGTHDQVLTLLRLQGRFPKSVTIDTNKNEIVLRDYSANVRRMLALIEQFNPSTAIARVANEPNPNVVKRTFSSFDVPAGPASQKQFDSGELNLNAADLSATLDLYQKVSGRTVIRSGALRQIEVTLHNQTPLNRVETLQLLDTTLAQHGINMVVAGDNAVIATQDPGNAVPPIINFPASQLPDSSSYMMTMVRLIQSDTDLPADTSARGTRGPPGTASTPATGAGLLVRTLSMKSKVPGGIIYMPAAHLLILRDFSSSIRQMLPDIPEVGP